MTHLALSAIGRDRPGIVAGVTAVLLDHELNVEDSQMTILRGQFTMTLVVAGADDLDAEALKRDLDTVAAELGLETLSISELHDPGVSREAAPTHIVSVYGSDHPGIVHAVSSALAQREINVTDLNTRLLGEDDLYVMMLEVALPPGVNMAEVAAILRGIGGEQGVEVSVRELDHDEL